MMYCLKAWKKNMQGCLEYIGVFAIPLSIISATWRPGVVSFCSAHLAVYNLHCEKWEQWILQVIYDVSSWIETESVLFFYFIFLPVKFNSRLPCHFWNYIKLCSPLFFCPPLYKHLSQQGKVDWQQNALICSIDRELKQWEFQDFYNFIILVKIWR